MMEDASKPVHPAMRTRAVAAAAVGTALEWFDFTLYGALSATILPKLFFPAMDPTSSLLASLATFGVGLAARPLGAIVCGHLGDKLGRRNLMLATVSMMGLASMLMGLLPTYGTIGLAAPVLLVVLRILQGFALGGESTGAQLMAIEYASPDRRGAYAGLLGVCSPLSQIMANGVLLALSAAMSPAAFESYGWRIPFLLSFLLIVIGVYIRLKVSETPAFEALRRTSAVRVGHPLRDVIRLHGRSVLRWMLFFCGPAALFYLIVVFSLSYITKTLELPKQTGFLLLMGANVCAIIGALAGGLLSDRIGRKKALAIGSIATLAIGSSTSGSSRPGASSRCCSRWAGSSASRSSRAASSRSRLPRRSRPTFATPGPPSPIPAPTSSRAARCRCSRCGCSRCATALRGASSRSASRSTSSR
jgi:MFS family permease